MVGGFRIHDAAEMVIAHNGNAIGDAKNFWHFAGNDKAGLPFFRQIDDQLIDFIFGPDVDSSGRFVEEEKVWRGFQPFSNDDFLLVAAAKSHDAVIGSHAAGMHHFDFPFRGFLHFGIADIETIDVFAKARDAGIEGEVSTGEDSGYFSFFRQISEIVFDGVARPFEVERFAFVKDFAATNGAEPEDRFQ